MGSQNMGDTMLILYGGLFVCLFPVITKSKKKHFLHRAFVVYSYTVFSKLSCSNVPLLHQRFELFLCLIPLNEASKETRWLLLLINCSAVDALSVTMAFRQTCFFG